MLDSLNSRYTIAYRADAVHLGGHRPVIVPAGSRRHARILPPVIRRVLPPAELDWLIDRPNLGLRRGGLYHS